MRVSVIRLSCLHWPQRTTKPPLSLAIAPAQPTLVFDFDGVIADSADVEHAIINMIAKRRGAAPMSKAEIRATPRTRLRSRLNIPAWQVPYYMRFGYSQMHALRTNIRLHSDIVPILAWAGQVGVRCIILSTNTSEVIRSFLTRYLPAHKDITVISKIPMFKKCEALKALQKNGIRKMVYIGDEVRDIEAANGAGIGSIGIGWGKDSLETLAATGCNACAHDGQELQKYAESAVACMRAALCVDSPDDIYVPPTCGAKKGAVRLVEQLTTCVGAPVVTTCPPAIPAPGPMSMTQSL